jgi:hypothetical protein
VLGSGKEGEPGLAGQGSDDACELDRGVAGEIDDSGEPGGQRGAGGEQVVNRAGPTGQDDGELVPAMILVRGGQLPPRRG